MGSFYCYFELAFTAEALRPACDLVNGFRRTGAAFLLKED